ncbi:hypothetical protein G6F42_021931 [Rhizopus arrhizus]|nr:hypothetical protein G6F42_021931 [Rhizopus arrhizus]
MPGFMTQYIGGKERFFQQEEAFRGMTRRQVSCCKERLLLHGEEWRAIEGFPDRVISNYRRIAAKSFHNVKVGYDGRLKVALEDQKAANQRTLNVRWLDSLVHQHFVRNDVQPGEILYLVHRDNDSLNNMLSNIEPMGYNQYHQYKRERYEESAIEWRDVRVGNPLYFINPYFNTTQDQYVVSSNGQVHTKAGEAFKEHPYTRGKRIQLYIDGEKKYVLISKKGIAI